MGHAKTKLSKKDTVYSYANSIPEQIKQIQSHCDGFPVVNDAISGEIVCAGCGAVLLEHSVDREAGNTNERIDYQSQGNSAVSSMIGGSYSTVISEKDAQGRALSNSMKNEFVRLKLLNIRSKKTTSNKSLRKAVYLLNTVKAKLGLPEPIVENAVFVYKKAMSKRITIGRDACGIMCASIYVACRQGKVPRQLDEISKVANIGKKEIGKSYRTLVNELDLSIDTESAASFLTKMANEVGISEKVRRSALDMLVKLQKKDTVVAGKNPIALAAGALYVACLENNQPKSQAAISRASGITTTTIRSTYSVFEKTLQLKTINH